VPSIDASLVKGFSSGKEMDEYLYTHPNSVVSAVEFFKESDKNYAFSVQTNGTVRWFKGVFQQPHLYAQLPVVVAVQKALASMIAGTPIEWTVRIGEYPHPAVSVRRRNLTSACSAFSVHESWYCTCRLKCSQANLPRYFLCRAFSWY
jgi:hypothetical protein